MTAQHNDCFSILHYLNKKNNVFAFIIVCRLCCLLYPHIADSRAKSWIVCLFLISYWLYCNRKKITDCVMFLYIPTYIQIKPTIDCNTHRLSRTSRNSCPVFKPKCQFHCQFIWLIRAEICLGILQNVLFWVKLEWNAGLHLNLVLVCIRSVSTQYSTIEQFCFGKANRNEHMYIYIYMYVIGS